MWTNQPPDRDDEKQATRRAQSTTRTRRTPWSLQARQCPKDSTLRLPSCDERGPSEGGCPGEDVRRPCDAQPTWRGVDGRRCCGAV